MKTALPILTALSCANLIAFLTCQAILKDINTHPGPVISVTELALVGVIFGSLFLSAILAVFGLSFTIRDFARGPFRIHAPICTLIASAPLFIYAVEAALLRSTF